MESSSIEFEPPRNSYSKGKFEERDRVECTGDATLKALECAGKNIFLLEAFSSGHFRLSRRGKTSQKSKRPADINCE